MRCQICNRDTNNWRKNPKTGQYESICSYCQNIIDDSKNYYSNFDEAEVESHGSFLKFLEEEESE